MSGFFNNLFGTIANNYFAPQQNGLITPTGFIPINNNGGTLRIKGNQAVWLGLRTREMQKAAYEFCYPLASVIDRLAEYDTAGELEILRSKGKGKHDEATNPWATRMRARLAQPNPLQSWEQFRSQQIVNKKIFGFCPVFPLLPIGVKDKSYCLSMWNLPPWLFKAEATNDIINTSTIEEIVKKYYITIKGKVIEFTPDQIFILEDGVIMDENENFILPQSKLVGLDMAVSNICAAMEADNVLLRKKGPLGFISHDAAAVKDSTIGYLPMKEHEKIEIQDSLAQYGMSWDQFQYVISKTAIKWNSMSYNVAELGTKDTIIAGEKAICHRFGFPYVLYEETESAFANGENAASSVYQNNVIPNSKKDLNKYNAFFGADENGCVIQMCYDDIPALQEDQLNKNQADSELANTLEVEYNNNVITKNQWLTARGYDSIKDGDYYKSDANNSDPLAVKLGVGGTQALIDLLANPALGPESKRSGLVVLFGLSDEDAARLTAEPATPIETTQNV